MCLLCRGWWVFFCGSVAVQTVEFDEGAGAVLRIQPLRAPRDENIYECVARNSEGEVSVTAKLAIIRGEAPPRPPIPTCTHPISILFHLTGAFLSRAHTWVQPSFWVPWAVSCRCDNRATPCLSLQAAVNCSFYSPSSVRPSVIWPQTGPTSVLAKG